MSGRSAPPGDDLDDEDGDWDEPIADEDVPVGHEDGDWGERVDDEDVPVGAGDGPLGAGDGPLGAGDGPLGAGDGPLEDEDGDWGDDGATEWSAIDDDDHAAAVRTVRMVLVALVLVVVGVGALALARAADDDDGGRTADDPVLGEAPAIVGPTAGTPVADYVAAQRAALADLDGERIAVVSLVSYRSAAAVDEIVAAVAGIEVEARVVALPGGAPMAVDEPFAEWVDGLRAPLQAERDEIARILPTIEDPDDPFIPGYAEDLARLDAQLASLHADAELVSGLIVRGGADALRRLAERAEVRVLAVAPDDDLQDLTRYRGVRPEEVDLVGVPPTRPAPAPA